MTKKEMEVKEKKTIDNTEGEPTKKGIYFTPPVDIFETEEAITLMADVPGASQEGLDIDLREGILTITADVPEPEKKGDVVYKEYDVGGFTRRFQIGKEIDQEKITAELDSGVLTLNLPKAESLKPRKIPVSVG